MFEGGCIAETVFGPSGVGFVPRLDQKNIYQNPGALISSSAPSGVTSDAPTSGLAR